MPPWMATPPAGWPPYLGVLEPVVEVVVDQLGELTYVGPRFAHNRDIPSRLAGLLGINPGYTHHIEDTLTYELGEALHPLKGKHVKLHRVRRLKKLLNVLRVIVQIHLVGDDHGGTVDSVSEQRVFDNVKGNLSLDPHQGGPDTVAG